VNVEMDLGDGFKSYTRDTNVMPQWAASSWYELALHRPVQQRRVVRQGKRGLLDGPAACRTRSEGTPAVSICTSAGVEHRVLHLLYVRFWHKVLYDLGHVSSKEPFRRLVNQGYIQRSRTPIRVVRMCPRPKY